MRFPFRLLMEPDSGGLAGGGNPIPAPTPVAPPAPAAKTVTLSYADFEALNAAKAENAALKEVEARRAVAEQEARDNLLKEKGKWEELHRSTSERLDSELKARDQKLAEIDRRFRSTLLNEKLTLALSGFELVPGAAAQLAKLYRDEFEVVEAGDSFRVQARTQESVDAFLKAELAKPENEHWLKPSGKGGTGAGGGDRRDPARPAGAPKNLGEEAIALWLAKQSQRPRLGLGGIVGGKR